MLDASCFTEIKQAIWNLIVDEVCAEDPPQPPVIPFKANLDEEVDELDMFAALLKCADQAKAARSTSGSKVKVQAI